MRTIGLYNTKAKNIIRLSQMLIDQHGGEVPADREILQTLPGVGRKTANVVLNIVFRQPTMAVDTHIFRVSNRTGLAPGKTPGKVEQKLEKVVPAEPQAPRPSLADPAWALCLQGPQARLPGLHRCATLPLQGEDGRSLNRHPRGVASRRLIFLRHPCLTGHLARHPEKAGSRVARLLATRPLTSREARPTMDWLGTSPAAMTIKGGSAGRNRIDLG